MTWCAVPVGLRALNAGYVAVHITPAAEMALWNVIGWDMRPGWHTLKASNARLIASDCEAYGQANRKEPMTPGARIALQGLARQIRHRLEKQQ